MNLFDNFHSLLILNSVPKTVTCNHNEIMIFNFKTCDFWFTDDNFWSWLLRLEISKSSGCRKSPREHSQRAHNLIIISSVCLSDGCCLVDFSSSSNYSFLFIRIWGLMVFADLIEFFTVLACQHRSWISKICDITCVLVNESNQGTWSTIVTFLFPFFFCQQKCFSQSVWYIAFPVKFEEKLMKMILQKLRTHCSSMAIINWEPFCILFKVNGNFIFIRTSIQSFMSDGRVALNMRF